MVAIMDLSLKPSLARYEMRPEIEVQTRKAEATKDEGMLEMVERQAAVAHMKMMCGEPKQACLVLRRAFLEADQYSKSAVPAPPAARLALAAIRLNLCVVLSRIGEHDRALAEARGALCELEDMWQTICTASAEDEVAVRNGDVLRRFDPVIVLLRKPPSWVGKAVEVNVQVRQCIAVELEHLQRASRAARAAKHQERGGGGGGAAAAAPPTGLSCVEEEAAAGEAAASSPGAMSHGSGSSQQEVAAEKETWLEVERMHKEAVSLAHDLLPVGHEVRTRAERCLHEVRLRFHAWWQKHERKLGSLASREGNSSPSTTPVAAPREMEAEAEGGEEASQLGAAPPIEAGDAEGQEEPAESFTDEAEAKGSSTSPQSTGLQRTRSSERHLAVAQPELLQARSESSMMAERSGLPTSRTEGHFGMSHSLSHFGGGFAGNTSTWTSGFESRHNKDRDKDPFAEWRRTVVNRHHMNYLQRTLRREEGMTQLKEDLKTKGKQFKQIWLKDLEAADPDRLFDDRILYNPSSVRLRQKVRDRIERARTPEQEEDHLNTLRKQADRDRLFKHYGVHFAGSEPNLGAYVKLMSSSSPAEQERLRDEEQQRKRREFAESMRRQAEKERMMQKMRVTKSGQLVTDPSSEVGIYGFLGQMAQQSFERARLDSQERRAAQGMSGRRGHDTGNGPRIPGRRMSVALQRAVHHGPVVERHSRRMTMAISRIQHPHRMAGPHAPHLPGISTLRSAPAGAFADLPRSRGESSVDRPL